MSNKLNQISLNLTYASLFVLSIAVFTSISFGAISHILIILPSLYFASQYKKLNIKFTKSMWALTALIIISIISVLSNLDHIERPLKNIFKTKYFLISLISIFSYRALFTSKLSLKKQKILIYSLLLATTIATISGLIAVYTGFNPIKMKNACHATRACGLFGMYMTYGYGISLFMVMTTGLLIYKNQLEGFINKNFIYMVFVVNFVGMVVAYARGGWIGYLAAVPFFFFKENKKKFVIIIAAFSILFLLLFQFNSKVHNMFAGREGSDTTRIALWHTAIKAFKERPLFGIGYRNFETNVPKLKKKYNIAHPWHAGHGHSNYFEHLASTGILGLIALMAFLTFWLIELYNSPHVLGKILFPTVLSFIISGLFQYTFGDGENLFFIMGLYSLSMAIPASKDIYVEPSKIF